MLEIDKVSAACIESCAGNFKVISFKCEYITDLSRDSLQFRMIILVFYLCSSQPKVQIENRGFAEEHFVFLEVIWRNTSKMVGGIAWSETFPTKTTLFIFLGYMSLFVCQGACDISLLNAQLRIKLNKSDHLNLGIFVTASQDKQSNKYKYNTIFVVLITELVKLVVSVLLYWKR